MVDLIAEPAVAGLPVTHGRATLATFDPGHVTAIAPYPGREVPGFPAPGQVRGPMVWAGRGMAFLLGDAPPDLGESAAVTDQSDGWAWVTLSGPDAVAVLARLCPLDLRPATFAIGSSARTVLQHLSVLLMRTEQGFVIAAYRSMARTLVHEVEAAMQAVAARRAL